MMIIHDMLFCQSKRVFLIYSNRTLLGDAHQGDPLSLDFELEDHLLVCQMDFLCHFEGGEFGWKEAASSVTMRTAYITQITRFMGPTWDPPGSCRPQVGPMLAHRPCYHGTFSLLLALSEGKPPVNDHAYTHWGGHFPDDIFKCIFSNEKVWISINVSLTFVPNGPINNIPALVQIVAWRRSGDKPLFPPMMASLLKHICVPWPQWVIMMPWHGNVFHISVPIWSRYLILGS